MLSQSIGKNSIVLSLFALVTAALLSMTFAGTKERIAESEKRAAQKALLEILPQETHDNDLLNDVWAIPEKHLPMLGLKENNQIHIARQNGNPVAVIIPSVAPDGYSGDIKMIIGISMSGELAGVRVLSHKETPGLGDKIDLNKNDWILSFEGKSLTQPPLAKWEVKKDGGAFDQFTGATITPRAVVHRVRDTLVYFQAHKEQILESP